MVAEFHHGSSVLEIVEGALPYRLGRSYVIGLLGTASQGPENVPTLISSYKQCVEIFGNVDGTHTIPDAMAAITAQQIGGLVVVIRVPVGATEAETKSNVIGGVDTDTNQYTGLRAFLQSRYITQEAGPTNTEGVSPKLLIFPGWGHDKAVVEAAVPIADKLRAMIICDGPNTNNQDALALRQGYISKRIYMVDPGVWTWDTANSVNKLMPASPFVAGMISKNDHLHGWWTSPSNKSILGIQGLGRFVSFDIEDPDCDANRLNENQVTTLINSERGGFQLWGNRTCHEDPKLPFIHWVRIGDQIDETLIKSSQHYLDKNLHPGYVGNIMQDLDQFLRELKATPGSPALLHHRVWADPTKNPVTGVKEGRFVVDFEVTYPPPLENLVYHRTVTDRGMSNLILSFSKVFENGQLAS